LQKGLSERLIKEKRKALLEIFKDLLQDGWVTIEVRDEDGAWVYYFVKDVEGRDKRIRMGVIDSAVKWAEDELYATDLPIEVGVNYSYSFDARKYGFSGEEGSKSHLDFINEFADEVIWADRPVKEFTPSKHLIKYYYSKGFKMRVKTKEGRRYLYAMKRDSTEKVIKRNLGLKL